MGIIPDGLRLLGNISDTGKTLRIAADFICYDLYARNDEVQKLPMVDQVDFRKRITWTVADS